MSAEERSCGFSSPRSRNRPSLWNATAREAVARLALVELGGDELAERVLEPAQREQGALDPADLAQRGREAVLLPVGERQTVSVSRASTRCALVLT